MSPDHPSSSGRDPRHRPQRDLARRIGYALLGVVFVVLVGVAVALLIRRPERGHVGKPVGAREAAIGNALFDRAAAHCRLTAARGAPARTPALLLGVHASIRLFSGQARCEETVLAKATGVTALREDLSWAQAEPQPGRFDWTGSDSLVRTATEAGMMLLPVVDDAPPWAASTSASVPSRLVPYAHFVAALVARYGPRGTFWRARSALPDRPLVWFELWNEPYFAEHNRDPALYARLVRAAVTAGRAANPRARFLIEADTAYKRLDGSRGEWIKGMYAAVPDLGRYFDAVAVHAYGLNPAVYTPGGDTDLQPGRVAQAHAELADHGDGNKPLWVTEIGWSTCSGDPLCVSEAQQAKYLRTFLELVHTTWRSYVRAVFVYALRDSAPNPREDRIAWYGLLRPDLSHKPAWQVLHDAAHRAV